MNRSLFACLALGAGTALWTACGPAAITAGIVSGFDSSSNSAPALAVSTLTIGGANELDGVWFTSGATVTAEVQLDPVDAGAHVVLVEDANVLEAVKIEPAAGGTPGLATRSIALPRAGSYQLQVKAVELGAGDPQGAIASPDRVATIVVDRDPPQILDAVTTRPNSGKRLAVQWAPAVDRQLSHYLVRWTQDGQPMSEVRVDSTLTAVDLPETGAFAACSDLRELHVRAVDAAGNVSDTTPVAVSIACGGVGAFALAASLSMPGTATDVAADDLNHDGAEDLVATLPDQSALFVAIADPQNPRGAPQLAFTTQTLTLPGSTPSLVKIDDFNRDGNLDLLLGDGIANNVTFIPGDGTGAFDLSSVLVSPTAIAMVDMGVDDATRDGSLDVMTLHTAPGIDSTAVLLVGAGDGSFAMQTPLTVGGDVGRVILADYNRDSASDLVALDAAGPTLTLFRNNGTGIFIADGTAALTETPVDVLAEDMDGDRQPDLVVLTPQQVWLARGNGSGFDAPVAGAPSGGATQVLTEDLNSDAIPDVLLRQATQMDPALGGGSNGRGTGVFNPTGTPVGVAASAATVSDFDADRIEDFAAAVDTELQVWAGVGATKRSNSAYTRLLDPFEGSFPPESLGAGLQDVNRDGVVDLVTIDTAENRVSVFVQEGADGQGTGRFVKEGTAAAGFNPLSLAFADFDRDNITDMVLPSQVSAQQPTVLTLLRGRDDPVDRFTNGGALTIEGAQFGTPGPRTVRGIAAADLNRDGQVDLVLGAQGKDGAPLEGRVIIGELQVDSSPLVAPTFAVATLFDFTAPHIQIGMLIGTPVQTVRVADVNHDNEDDLIVTLGVMTNQSAAPACRTVTTPSGGPSPEDFGQLAILLGRRDQPFGFEDPVYTRLNWVRPGTAFTHDIDRDGNVDLVVSMSGCNGRNRRFEVLRGSGDGSFAPLNPPLLLAEGGGTDPAVPGTQVLGGAFLSDIDGDEVLDFVYGVEQTAGDAVLFFRKGELGTFEFGPPQELATRLNGPRVSFMGPNDINGDGANDILSVSRDNITVLLGVGERRGRQ
ncbi:MAG: VCBS repeat-containing protein [Planctomycetota bacterium]